MENTDQEALVESAESEDDIELNNQDNELRIQQTPHYLKEMFSASVLNIVQILVGVNAGVSLWFAFKTSPISTFQLHVGLSVISYQLLMVQGFLCLQGKTWSGLNLKNRRRVHWILQLSGSILAIAGSAVMIKSKNDAGKPHFGSVHGKLALAALVFTCASLINGVSSLYSVELRHLIPAKVSKLSHIVFGAAAFAISSACLATGFNMRSFTQWASQEFAYVMIGIVTVYSALIIVLPLFDVVKRVLRF